jgi:hypothetical protein
MSAIPVRYRLAYPAAIVKAVEVLAHSEVRAE